MIWSSNLESNVETISLSGIASSIISTQSKAADTTENTASFYLSKEEVGPSEKNIPGNLFAPITESKPAETTTATAVNLPETQDKMLGSLFDGTA